LDDLNDLGTDIFFQIIGYRNAMVAVGIHLDGGVNSLQQGFFINTGQNEASFI
jgi:hypothetical protein